MTRQPLAERIVKLEISGECTCDGGACSNCDKRARDLIESIRPHLAIKPAQRIAAVLADLDSVEAGRWAVHPAGCWAYHPGCLAARIRATLTGEDADER